MTQLAFDGVYTRLYPWLVDGVNNLPRVVMQAASRTRDRPNHCGDTNTCGLTLTLTPFRPLQTYCYPYSACELGETRRKSSV